AASFLLNWRIAYASLTFLPRIRSITSRILRGDWRTDRWIACPRISGLRLLVGHELAAVAAEEPGRGELAELVPDHVLRDIDRHELVAVVHREGVAHELGENGARPAPGL